MKAPFVTILFIACTLIFCLLAIKSKNADYGDNAITLYCAAGLRLPVSEIVEQYYEETGCVVNVIYNGSGALLSQIKIGGGDLYLPAHSSYVEDAVALGLADRIFPIAKLTAVVVVRCDSDKVVLFDDLADPGIKISFADESAAVGMFVKKLLMESGEFQQIECNIAVTKPTVNGILEDVSLGSVDATIAWDAVAHGFTDLTAIPYPLFEINKATIGFTFLNSSDKQDLTKAFAAYLVAQDKGMAVLKRHGFQTLTATRSTEVK